MFELWRRHREKTNNSGRRALGENRERGYGYTSVQNQQLEDVLDSVVTSLNHSSKIVDIISKMSNDFEFENHRVWQYIHDSQRGSDRILLSSLIAFLVMLVRAVDPCTLS